MEQTIQQKIWTIPDGGSFLSEADSLALIDRVQEIAFSLGIEQFNFNLEVKTPTDYHIKIGNLDERRDSIHEIRAVNCVSDFELLKLSLETLEMPAEKAGILCTLTFWECDRLLKKTYPEQWQGVVYWLGMSTTFTITSDPQQVHVVGGFGSE